MAEPAKSNRDRNFDLRNFDRNRGSGLGNLRHLRTAGNPEPLSSAHLHDGAGLCCKRGVLKNSLWIDALEKRAG